MKKPAIGIMPRHIYEERIKIERMNNILKAIKRYISNNQKIPIAWVDEYNELVTKLSMEKKK